MKLIKAIVRPTKVDVVKAALVNLDIVGMTITNVRGFGRQKGQVERYRGTEIKVDFLPKVKIEVVVNDDKLAAAVEVIQQASQTGEIGDGKIFVLPVEEAVRIRTGESGSLALRATGFLWPGASLQPVGEGEGDGSQHEAHQNYLPEIKHLFILPAHGMHSASLIREGRCRRALKQQQQASFQHQQAQHGGNCHHHHQG